MRRMGPDDANTRGNDWYFTQGAEVMRVACVHAVMDAFRASLDTNPGLRDGLWAATDVILAVKAPELGKCGG